MEFKFVKKENLKNLPTSPGVYCFKSEKEILYIGKAKNLRERVKNHFENPTFKENLFLDLVKEVGYIKLKSEIEALLLESKLIKEIQPRFNVIWRDDKNYFFVGKTNEKFPKIFLCHQPKIKNAEFVGPFVDGKSLKQTLKILRKIFPFRSCNRIPKRPCLWYYLGRCPGPCLLNSKYFKDLKLANLKIQNICQRNAEKIIKILREGKKTVLKQLRKEMKKAARNLDFEEAGRLRDQIFFLEKTLEHAKVFDEISSLKEWPEIEEKIKNLFGVKKAFRIEGFDVSNLRGKLAVGSLVTFLGGKPAKGFYRKFKVKFKEKTDDISALKEILFRRIKHQEWGIPDLVLIDGGKAQLNAGVGAKKENPNWEKVKFLALAKKENKLFIEGEKNFVKLENLPPEIANLILRIRDEAHRFAISFHRKLREKNLDLKS